MAERHPTTATGRRLVGRCFACVTPGAVAAIEDEARRSFLDELIAAGAVHAGMSYDEVLAALSRHRRLLLASVLEDLKGQEVAPGTLGGSDG